MDMFDPNTCVICHNTTESKEEFLKEQRVIKMFCPSCLTELIITNPKWNEKYEWREFLNAYKS
jgi:hypothetical protein